jgi:hypothetical protein
MKAYWDQVSPPIAQCSNLWPFLPHWWKQLRVVEARFPTNPFRCDCPRDAADRFARKIVRFLKVFAALAAADGQAVIPTIWGMQ